MTKTFNLTRQFALLSFLCILLISLVSGFLLSRFLTDKLLSRDATVSQDFIESIVEAEGTWSYFVAKRTGAQNPVLDSFFRHISHMPDVVRGNVYSSDRTILWSSDESLIGEHFPDNEELAATLRGKLTFESGIVGDTEKEEHRDLREGHVGLRFVETYVPVWNGDRSTVVGAVELYKVPRALHQSIKEGQRLVWSIAFGGGTVLFLSLFWIVRRANGIMNEQHQRLVESESLSMIGETASAVAHAMRNPLASIRASAELTLSDDLEGARESAADIIGEADRLDRWARELLQFSGTDAGRSERVDVNALVRAVLDEHATALSRAGIAIQFSESGLPLAVQANPAPLSQVLGNLVMNAIEAMDSGGTLTVNTALDVGRPSHAVVSVIDTGPGLSSAMKGRLFRPFATTKPTGTGLGLALSRRLVQHYDGTLTIHSAPGRGVTATIRLPAVR